MHFSILPPAAEQKPRCRGRISAKQGAHFISIQWLYQIFLSTIVLLYLFSTAWAESITVVGFNVESGDADPAVIAEQVTEIDGVDIWGFSEVQNQAWLEEFSMAAGADEGARFAAVLGTTGGGDRLGIVYDADRLELLDHFELDEINIGGRVRAPLVAKFRLKMGGSPFLFMVNHLYRGSEEGRHQQARLLNEWAEEQSLPVIATGDYNFDWSVEDGEDDHDAGYENMVKDGVFVWIRPESIIPTNCSHHRSVLDFVFVTHDAKDWSGSSQILFPAEDYCPDDDTTSDHRPVQASFVIAAMSSDGGQGAIIQQIEVIETELQKLREMIEREP